MANYTFDFLNYGVNLLTNDIKILLVNNYIIDISNHHYLDDIQSFEIVNAYNYTTSGQLLLNTGIYNDVVNSRYVFSASNVEWTTSRITSDGAIIYSDTGISSASPLICYLDFQSERVTNNTPFIINWNEYHGIFYNTNPFTSGTSTSGVTISNLFEVRTAMFSDYGANYYSMGNDTHMPNGYVTKCSSNYDNVRKVYGNMMTEMINQHGVCMKYYITTWNTNYDKIFGEDNDRRFERVFDVMSYYQLPKEEKLWTKFGIEGLDSFSMYISKLHFKQASTFGNRYVPGNIGINTYNNYIPKIGDIIMSDYTNYIYEVTEVKEEATMFLMSKQYVWELIVKTYKDEGIALSATTSASMSNIANYTDRDLDIFDVKTQVDTLKTDIKYVPKITESNSNDPFADW